MTEDNLEGLAALEYDQNTISRLVDEPQPPPPFLPEKPELDYRATAERVLCVTAGLAGEVKGVISGSSLDPLLLELMNPANHEFVDREVAENDPSRRQLIPYVLIRRGNQFFSYTRSTEGGESRLYGNKSLGVGGHINPSDGGGYSVALKREIKEEVGLDLEDVPAVVALIYDDSTDVGRVHLGVVHILDVRFTTALAHVDPAVANGDFHHILEIKADKQSYEPWSRMLLETLL